MYACLYVCVCVYVCVNVCMKIDLKYFATVFVRMSVSECSACLLNTYRIRLNKFEGPYYCGRD